MPQVGKLSFHQKVGDEFDHVMLDGTVIRYRVLEVVHSKMKTDLIRMEVVSVKCPEAEGVEK